MIITFEFDEFNRRRYMRTKYAARVKIFEDGELVGAPWMRPTDIKKNIEIFGENQGLIDAYNAFPGHKYEPFIPFDQGLIELVKKQIWFKKLDDDRKELIEKRRKLAIY